MLGGRDRFLSPGGRMYILPPRLAPSPHVPATIACSNRRALPVVDRTLGRAMEDVAARAPVHTTPYDSGGWWWVVRCGWSVRTNAGGASGARQWQKPRGQKRMVLGTSGRVGVSSMVGLRVTPSVGILAMRPADVGRLPRRAVLRAMSSRAGGDAHVAADTRAARAARAAGAVSAAALLALGVLVGVRSHARRCPALSPITRSCNSVSIAHKLNVHHANQPDGVMDALYTGAGTAGGGNQ
jgi:hypothetical protein